jgi:hypothetical protein
MQVKTGSRLSVYPLLLPPLLLLPPPLLLLLAPSPPPPPPPLRLRLPLRSDQCGAISF